MREITVNGAGSCGAEKRASAWPGTERKEQERGRNIVICMYIYIYIYIHIYRILLYTTCIITLQCTCELFPPRLTRPIHNGMTAAKVLPVIAPRAPSSRPNIVRPSHDLVSFPSHLSSSSLRRSWGRHLLSWITRRGPSGPRSTLLRPAAPHNRQIGTTKLPGSVISVWTTIGKYRCKFRGTRYFVLDIKSHTDTRWYYCAVVYMTSMSNLVECRAWVQMPINRWFGKHERRLFWEFLYHHFFNENDVKKK